MDHDWELHGSDTVSITKNPTQDERPYATIYDRLRKRALRLSPVFMFDWERKAYIRGVKDALEAAREASL